MHVVSAAGINWKSCQAKRFSKAFINMLIKGWKGGRRGEDASPDKWTDSSWLQTRFQLLSIVHEIRTRWLIIKQTHKVFTSERTNIWLLTVSILLFPLQKPPVFSGQFTQHSIPPSLHLSASSLFPACLWDPFSYLLLSGSFCSALVLLVLKRSGCVITTRPDLRRKLRDKGEDRCKEKDFRQKGMASVCAPVDVCDSAYIMYCKTK